MIRTGFHEIFKTRIPIVQGGMGPYDTTHLAAAVAKAGGEGLISTVGMGCFEIPGTVRTAIHHPRLRSGERIASCAFLSQSSDTFF